MKWRRADAIHACAHSTIRWRPDAWLAKHSDGWSVRLVA